MADEQNEKQKEMDAEAVRARGELEQNIDSWNARAVAAWWGRWYLKAGHKRLGRTLVDIAKKQAK
jgi:hypothetical protein